MEEVNTAIYACRVLCRVFVVFSVGNMSWKCRVKVCYNVYRGNLTKTFKGVAKAASFCVVERRRIYEHSGADRG